MNKIILGLILFLGFMFSFSSSYGIQAYYSDEELMQKSDLVISGEVIKTQNSDLEENPCGPNVERILATVQIDKLFKGDSKEQSIFVEYCGLNPRLELDAQDIQLKVGSKGTVYLSKLLNGHYKIFGGWLGWKNLPHIAPTAQKVSR